MGGPAASDLPVILGGKVAIGAQVARKPRLDPIGLPPKRTREEPRMSENVIVTSKVKEAVKELDLRLSSDVPEALNAKVHELLKAGGERARANGRATLRASDL